MLRELLEVYKPKQRGFVSTDEFMLIKDTLCLGEMDVLAMRNLRDFVVLAMTKRYDGLSFSVDDWDRMSAITYVIDAQIVKIGGEV